MDKIYGGMNLLGMVMRDSIRKDFTIDLVKSSYHISQYLHNPLQSTGGRCDLRTALPIP